MKITLIAGHGAGDPGAIGTYNGKVYKEADETRRMVSLIAARLQRNGIDAIVRDTTKNAYKDALANRLVFPKVQYLLEVHFNALSASTKDGKTKGVECYVTTDEQGTTVEEKICAAVSSFGLRNRGVKRKNFAVINKAKKAGISSALLEVCFIDDPDDMEIYTEHTSAIAIAIADAICYGFGIPQKRSNRDIVQSKTGFDDRTMKYLDGHPFKDALYEKLVKAMGGSDL